MYEIWSLEHQPFKGINNSEECHELAGLIRLERLCLRKLFELLQKYLNKLVCRETNKLVCRETNKLVCRETNKLVCSETNKLVCSYECYQLIFLGSFIFCMVSVISRNMHIVSNY